MGNPSLKGWYRVGGQTLVTTRQGQLEQEILRTLAESPTYQGGVSRLLRMMNSLVHAGGSALVVAGEAQPLVIAEGVAPAHLPDAEGLLAKARGLASLAFHTEPVPAGSGQGVHAVAPILTDGEAGTAKALVWFVSTQPPALAPEDATSLLQAFTVFARQIMTQAHYEKLNRNQMEFFRIVLHDLRSPLTSARGFADMLLSGSFAGVPNEKQAYALEKIQSNVNAIASIVDNVQDAGRYDPETGFYEMQKSLCDMVEIVDRIVGTYIIPAEKQELTIETTLHEVPIIQADKTMLERAVTNLVDNAIKYTPNGGRVEVALHHNENDIIFTVRDSGYGISPENQKNLFQRHVRIPRQEHKRIKGTGLGLFIVRSVAQHHGGRAWVESREGEGSTFGISIPLNGATIAKPQG